MKDVPIQVKSIGEWVKVFEEMNCTVDAETIINVIDSIANLPHSEWDKISEIQNAITAFKLYQAGGRTV